LRKRPRKKNRKGGGNIKKGKVRRIKRGEGVRGGETCSNGLRGKLH